jgi:hypothetical protein
MSKEEQDKIYNLIDLIIKSWNPIHREKHDPNETERLKKELINFVEDIKQNNTWQ